MENDMIGEGWIEGMDNRQESLKKSIAEFETWQNLPDPDDRFEAIHVAFLLSQSYGKIL